MALPDELEHAPAQSRETQSSITAELFGRLYRILDAAGVIVLRGGMLSV